MLFSWRFASFFFVISVATLVMMLVYSFNFAKNLSLAYSKLDATFPDDFISKINYLSFCSKLSIHILSCSICLLTLEEEEFSKILPTSSKSRVSICNLSSLSPIW